MLTGEEAEEGGDIFDYFPWAISRNQICMALKSSSSAPSTAVAK